MEIVACLEGHLCSMPCLRVAVVGRQSLAADLSPQQIKGCLDTLRKDLVCPEPLLPCTDNPEAAVKVNAIT